MAYMVVFSRETRKSIDRLGEVEKRRIKDKIGELMVDPYKAGKPLMGAFKARNTRSCRIGSYRLLYTVFEDKRTVLMVRVDRRRRVYRV